MKSAPLMLAATAMLAIGSVTATALAQSTAEPAAAAASTSHAERPGDADGAFVTPLRFSEPTGEKLYKRVCAGCHMPDGKGAQGAGFYPSLVANPKLEAPGYPLYVVLHGMNGMPPVGKSMTDQQVADVVNHIRTHFGNRYKDKASAQDAKAAR